MFSSQVVREDFCLTVPKNTPAAEPYYLVFSEGHVCSNKIIVEENASVIVIEEYSANSTMTVTSEIILRANARAQIYKIQNENSESTHEASIQITQAENSELQYFTFSRGALKQNDQITVHLSAKNAACHFSGFYFLKENNQEIQHHLDIHHAAEYGTSSMFYKGIVGNNARAAFRGKVKVNKDAQHIQTTQANHNLLLSKLAEVSSKPELEIYADNVKCTHGATVGELDAEALFYLRSRGVDQATATKLLLNAFAEDVFKRIPNESIKNFIREKVGHHVEY